MKGRGVEDFFFEKKKQKTFFNLGRAGETAPGPAHRSFLLLFFKKEVLSCLLASILSLGLAVANTPTTITRDGVVLTIPQEKRAEFIGDKLRCLVCQNETVENSQADLAKQFRGIIRRRVVKHESNAHIIDFMVHRYGIFVLLKPPLMPLTWLLWFSPGIALAIGLVVLLIARRRRQIATPPLSPDEHERLKELMP